MKKNLICLFIILLSSSIYSQDKFWGDASKEIVSRKPKVERESLPGDYKLFSLNLKNLKTKLKLTPRMSRGVDSNVIISFPNPNGGFDRFKIFNSPVMEQKFANSHQDINSYSGKGIDDPTLSIRFSVTLFGLNAMVFSKDDIYYIDTYTKDLSNYIVYFKKNVEANGQFGCSTEEEGILNNLKKTEKTSKSKMNDGILRTFRLAISCTKEYSIYHIDAAGVSDGTDAEKKEAVLAAINVLLTRINGIYENELSVHFDLVNNLDIIYIASGDPYANSNSDLNVVQGVIDNAVGSANYDIGHVLTTGSGKAGIGVICDDSSKAEGTTGKGTPIGDSFFVDYVAHEMGHQFGANHIWSGISVHPSTACTIGRRVLGSAMEPGSGSTIMSYTGICYEMNIQPRSDAYFNAKSLAEMEAVILSTNCYGSVPNGNHAPVVNAFYDKKQVKI